MPSLILPARGNAGKGGGGGGGGGGGKSREETGKKGDGQKRNGYVLFLLSSKHVYVRTSHMIQFHVYDDGANILLLRKHTLLCIINSWKNAMYDQFLEKDTTLEGSQNTQTTIVT